MKYLSAVALLITIPALAEQKMGGNPALVEWAAYTAHIHEIGSSGVLRRSCSIKATVLAHHNGVTEIGTKATWIDPLGVESETNWASAETNSNVSVLAYKNATNYCSAGVSSGTYCVTCDYRIFYDAGNPDFFSLTACDDVQHLPGGGGPPL